jgi:hypothetical protein
LKCTCSNMYMATESKYRYKYPVLHQKVEDGVSHEKYSDASHNSLRDYLEPSQMFQCSVTIYAYERTRRTPLTRKETGADDESEGRPRDRRPP